MMLKKSMNELIEIINNNLDGIIKSSPLNTKLEESMQYSLDAGGKNSSSACITHFRSVK